MLRLTVGGELKVRINVTRMENHSHKSGIFDSHIGRDWSEVGILRFEYLRVAGRILKSESSRGS
jgi:hypothetical protein